MTVRVTPIAIGAILLLSAGKAAALFTGQDERPRVTPEPPRDQFGTHERVWADDLLEKAAPQQTAPVVENAAENTAKTDLSFAPAGREPQADHMALITASYLEPLEALRLLEAERAALEEAQAGLEDVKVIANLAENRAKDQLTALTEARDDLRKLVGEVSEADEKDLTRMVGIYINMKPKEAAAILEDMDTITIVRLVERMAERQSAPILARMNVTRAQEVMAVMSDRERRSELLGAP